jgi:DNA primase
MQFDKQEIVDLLEKEGKNEHVQKALAELPDKIDHDKHAQMLEEKFGIDPGKLAAKAIEKELGQAQGQAAK